MTTKKLLLVGGSMVVVLGGLAAFIYPLVPYVVAWWALFSGVLTPK